MTVLKSKGCIRILGRKWLVIGCKKVWRVRTCLDPFNYKKFLDLLLWIQCWVQTVLSGPCSQLCLEATTKFLILHAACMLNTLDFIGSELVAITSKSYGVTSWKNPLWQNLFIVIFIDYNHLRWPQNFLRSKIIQIKDHLIWSEVCEAWFEYRWKILNLPPFLEWLFRHVDCVCGLKVNQANFSLPRTSYCYWVFHLMVLYILQYIYWYFVYSQFLSQRTFKIHKPLQ